MNRHWSLAHLGLPGDADARAIKRGYAAKLKTTRPEDDPEGFQRLHEAYQAALSWVQSRDAEAESDDDLIEDIDAFAEDAQSGALTRTLSQDALFDLLYAQPGEPAMPFPDASADRQATVETTASLRDEAASFDPEALIHDCIAAAMRSHDGDLLEWLNAHPALWSLAQKTRLAPWLLQRLHEQRPPIPASRFDILGEFFGLFDLHSSYDAYSIQRLRHRLQLTWEIQTWQVRALAERTAQDGGSMAANLRQAGRMLRQLSRLVQWPQVLWAGLMPGYPSAVRSFLRRLDFGNLDDLPGPIREDQVAFWDAAGDRSRFSTPRWTVSVARLFAYTLAIAMMFALFTTTTSSRSAFRATSIADVIGGSFATMLAGWLAYLAYDSFMRWQALPESAPSRLPVLRVTIIPLLAAVTLFIDQWLGFDPRNVAMPSALFLLTLQRYRLRNGLNWEFRPNLRQTLAAFVGLFALCIVFAYGFIAVGIVSMTLALWALDMHQQRAALRN